MRLKISLGKNIGGLDKPLVTIFKINYKILLCFSKSYKVGSLRTSAKELEGPASLLGDLVRGFNPLFGEDDPL